MDGSMVEAGGTTGKVRCALALALAFVGVPVAAQSVSDYKLPGATASPGPDRVQGPVDNDNPVIRAPRPSPIPTPTPSIAAEPIAPGATPPVATAGSLPASPRSVPQPRQRTREAGAQPAPAPLAASGPASSAAAPLPAPDAVPTAATPTPNTPLVAAPTADGAALPTWWPWAAGGTALAGLGLLAVLLTRRRRPRIVKAQFEPPVETQPAQPVEPPQRPTKAESPAPALTLSERPEPAPPQPAPPAAEPTGDLAIMLEARRMSASLMATTLSYRLVLTNRTKRHLTALAVEGDMVSAHASLPPDQQIASDGLRLELRHALVELAPGESAEFTGDFRLPLSAVTPIRAGEAAYFVPLARVRVEAATPSGEPLVRVQTFVVGELPEPQGAALRPFRLDLGPRTYSRIGQRAVS